MWSEENTEALKNKIAELKNKSLKKQSMENSNETNMEFTHAQRWDLSVMKILELETSLKEQGLEMAGLEKKISDLSDDCCNIRICEQFIGVANIVRVGNLASPGLWLGHARLERF